MPEPILVCPRLQTESFEQNPLNLLDLVEVLVDGIETTQILVVRDENLVAAVMLLVQMPLGCAPWLFG
jgi:hypothetical protein